MPDVITLKDAIERRGPYSVWDLLTEDEQREAAGALWENADRESRGMIELALANDLKFRPHMVRRLSTDRVVGRLTRLADSLPENALFQFLFHLHMTNRRDLLVEFLDAVELPHEEGVLNLPDDFETPDAEKVKKAAADLAGQHDHRALVYLATLKVADDEFWSGVDGVLEAHAEDGSSLE
jgi:hypothetical protein